MKISQFAKKFKVSNDTIRYYMDLKLIIPEKKVDIIILIKNVIFIT